MRDIASRTPAAASRQVDRFDGNEILRGNLADRGRRPLRSHSNSAYPSLEDGEPLPQKAIQRHEEKSLTGRTRTLPASLTSFHLPRSAPREALELR